MKDSIIIATIKSWNIENCKDFAQKYKQYNTVLITEKKDLDIDILRDINPRYIFFPHWSWKIQEDIYSQYECVVFHETDLPFGRGGSPIQNLLVRGIYNTTVSAIRVVEEIDAGPIYCKESVSLEWGNVDEILSRVSKIVFSKMIPFILDNKPIPVKQEGRIVNFSRRKPEQSEIPEGLSPQQLYDFIRMLDGEGYPRAFRSYDGGKVYFSEASIADEVVIAKARFEKNS